MVFAGAEGPSAATPSPGSPAPPRRLNIVSIVTDDQSSWGMGAYGNPDARTPVLDRLAREGVLFRNAFVTTPVCSPSRAGFLTGRYGTELGIRDWISPEEGAGGLGLPPGTPTWPALLREHGWRTALVGKWHLGRGPRSHPSAFGIERFFGFLDGGNTPMDPTLEVEGREQALKGSLPDLLTDEAIRFVTESRDRPFALLLHFRAPHLPYGPVPEEDSAALRDVDPSLPDVRGIDRDAGEEVDPRPPGQHPLRRPQRGPAARGARPAGPHRPDDRPLHERQRLQHRPPHPPHQGQRLLDRRRRRRPAPAEHVRHVAPRAARPAGPRDPRGARGRGDGHAARHAPDASWGSSASPLPPGLVQHGSDFSPLLRGETVPWRDTVFGEFDMHHYTLARMRMIRTARHKLVRYLGTSFQDELYDLGGGPGGDAQPLPERAR